MAPTAEQGTVDAGDPALIDLARAVRAARSLLSRSSSLSLAPDAVVTGLLGGVAELSRAVDALQVRIAGEVAERSRGAAEQSLCKKLGARSAKEAVATAFGSRSRAAADLLALATATATSVGVSGNAVPAPFPQVGRALDEGALSLPQALAIVRVLEPAASRAALDELTWAEGALVDAAVDAEWPLGPELLTEQGRLYAAVLDPDGILPDAERQRVLRSASIHKRRDGMWRTEIISPAEEGSALKALLDAFTGPRVEVRFRDDIDPAAAGAHEGDGSDAHGDDGHGDDGHGGDGHGGDARSDDGYDDCDGRGSGGDGETSVMEADDERTLEQKRHDVLIGILREAAGKRAPKAGGEPPVLVLSGTIAAYQAYLQGIRHSAGYLTVEHTGDLLPMAWVDRLVCDGDVQLSIADDRHHTLVLGRTERLFTRAQRRALARRDRGCAVKRCGAPPAWCEAHHIVAWQAGGATDLDNGILLCSHHHHEVHAGRLRVEPTGRGPGSWRIVAQLALARLSRMVPLPQRAPADTGASMTRPAEDCGESAGGMPPRRTIGSMAAVSAPDLAVRVRERRRAASRRPQLRADLRLPHILLRR